MSDTKDWPKFDADNHVDPVAGQCGTCKWALGFTIGDCPSGPEDGVKCSCRAHVEDGCKESGENCDLEAFEKQGWISHFRFEVLVDESYICPRWQPRPGEVKDQWLPLPNAAQETTCPWCGKTYPLDDEAMTSVEAGYVDLAGPTSPRRQKRNTYRKL